MSRQAIVARHRRGAGVVRELECGHEQLELSGGRSKDATSAVCTTCPPDSARAIKLAPAPVDATCTAIIVPLRERRMRLCGRPAKVMNVRGQPRCGPCARKVAAS